MTRKEDLRNIIKKNMEEGYAGTGDSPYDQEFVDELYGKKESKNNYLDSIKEDEIRELIKNVRDLEEIFGRLSDDPLIDTDATKKLTGILKHYILILETALYFREDPVVSEEDLISFVRREISPEYDNVLMTGRGEFTPVKGYEPPKGNEPLVTVHEDGRMEVSR